MKVSRDWLQTFFEKPLPEAAALAEALTFHAFEIESVENDILDVKVTPNRGHDCLCHRGIAKELAAILDLPMKNDDLRQPVALGPKTGAVSVAIEDPELCPRYIAGLLRGVKVGPSPHWLRARLESVGQKSINNVVDAANYVMLRLGQPLHAFDAGKLMVQDTRYKILVRNAKQNERITTLDGKEYMLQPSNLLIVDGNNDQPIGIAGVKGGLPAAITEETTDLIIESAAFAGPSVRKTAQTLKLRTDASTRYEQGLSPSLAAYGMKAVVELIAQVAGGEAAGHSSDYALAPEKKRVSAPSAQINGILGADFSAEQIADALRRLDLSHEEKDGVFDIYVPFERLDLAIPEDIAEEVGRIIGYDKIPSVELSPMPRKPEVNANFYAAERKREELMARGYSEVHTSVFAEKGERVVANKVDGVRPHLRTSLVPGLKDAYEKNNRNKDLLGLSEIKLFEMGVVWKDGREMTMIGTADKDGAHEGPLASARMNMYENLPLSNAQRYQPFSKYPFIVRDISLWTPAGTKQETIAGLIKRHAGELLVREPQKFDEFKKGDKQSYAFRLVFQSFDRTLTDFDANERMESISAALKKQGFEIR